MVPCEICGNPAVVHATDIRQGLPFETHFCGDHAQEHLRAGVVGRLTSPYRLSGLTPKSFERLESLLAEAGISDKNRGQTVLPERTATVFVRLLADEEPCLRYWAACWLGKLGASASIALPALRTVSTNDSDRYVRDAAEAAIKKIEG